MTAAKVVNLQEGKATRKKKRVARLRHEVAEVGAAGRDCVKVARTDADKYRMRQAIAILKLYRANGLTDDVWERLARPINPSEVLTAGEIREALDGMREC